jgi:hypothetical protein
MPLEHPDSCYEFAIGANDRPGSFFRRQAPWRAFFIAGFQPNAYNRADFAKPAWSTTKPVLLIFPVRHLCSVMFEVYRTSRCFTISKDVDGRVISDQVRDRRLANSSIEHSYPRPPARKFNLSPLDISSYQAKFLGIPSLLKGRCRDACSAGRDAAPAGVGVVPCAPGGPWVTVRAHYGALP